MRIQLRCLAATLIVSMFIPAAFAGNEDRAGSAGAGYLLVNPWARSSGLANAHMANAQGVESTFLNVAGLAFVGKTELMFSQTMYLVGSGININSIGLAQRLNESSVLGLSVTNWNFGRIDRTTTEQPEGDGTTFSPNVLTIAASYARAFSNSIYGGITLRILNESTAEIRSTGVAIDAGIKYVTGENDRVKIGIALKNVGPEMTYQGDGMSFQGMDPSVGTLLTVEHRSARNELPSLVAIGATYDFQLSQHHRLTPGGTFIANSFTKDNFLVGLEYAFKELFALRGGYHYETGITSDVERMTVLTGVHAGLSVHVPLGKGGSDLSFDYGYRFTNPFGGIHTVGVAVGIK
jgi:hypothetical protein